MPAKKKTKPKKPPIQQFTFECPRETKDAFLKMCKENDTNGARELRMFIKKYLAKSGQQNLI